MSQIVDFLFWWFVAPRDDWAHLRFILLILFAGLLLVSSVLIVEDLRNPYAKHKVWLRPARPGRVIAAYLAIGVIAGAVAALVLPELPVAPTVTRYAGIVVVATAVSVIAAGMSHLRSSERSHRPSLVFWQYFTLVAGSFATRLALSSL